jgi:hypothetical protein
MRGQDHDRKLRTGLPDPDDPRELIFPLGPADDGVEASGGDPLESLLDQRDDFGGETMFRIPVENRSQFPGAVLVRTDQEHFASGHDTLPLLWWKSSLSMRSVADLPLIDDGTDFHNSRNSRRACGRFKREPAAPFSGSIYDPGLQGVLILDVPGSPGGGVRDRPAEREGRSLPRERGGGFLAQRAAPEVEDRIGRLQE